MSSEGVSWDYFNRFVPESNYTSEGGYLPPHGEGVNMAQQCVTAVNKLIYEWYNNGGVYDNRYNNIGVCNDVSSYANWLRANIYGADDILDRIEKVSNGNDYETYILKPLADLCFDRDMLKRLAEEEAWESVYDRGGPFYIDWDKQRRYEEYSYNAAQPRGRYVKRRFNR